MIAEISNVRLHLVPAIVPANRRNVVIRVHNFSNAVAMVAQCPATAIKVAIPDVHPRQRNQDSSRQLVVKSSS